MVFLGQAMLSLQQQMVGFCTDLELVWTDQLSSMSQWEVSLAHFTPSPRMSYGHVIYLLRRMGPIPLGEEAEGEQSLRGLLVALVSRSARGNAPGPLL